MSQQHVEVVQEPVAQNQQILWQPVVGEETTRLLADSDLDETAQGSVVTQAVEVLQRCASPTASSPSRTGLVVGYVQSGKTMSFTTVIGLARDFARLRVVLGQLRGDAAQLLQLAAQHGGLLDGLADVAKFFVRLLNLLLDFFEGGALALDRLDH